MFSIEMLPARQGDCLWIEYGDEDAPRIVLIDGGMTETADAIREKIAARARDEKLRIEVLVVTHIDNDHILGVIDLLKETGLELEIGDVWFNGRPQLEHQFHSDVLGVDQGDELSELLATMKLAWNETFDGELVYLGDGAPRQVELDGGLTLTVIGPPMKRLEALAAKWLDVKSGVDKTADDEDENADVLGKKDTWPAKWKAVSGTDKSVANGSSIALVAEYDGARILLTGDAFAADLVEGLDRYQEHYASDEGDGVAFAALKMSHHGSVNNISEALVQRVNCESYLISTDGTQHKHPDTQALLRVIQWCNQEPKLWFNYHHERTAWWLEQKSDLEEKYRGYSADVGEDGWLKLDLMP